jgi:predicted transposase/invertase (TIGR01784 family)
LYTWADIYSNQLQSGEKYHQLRPTYSIWLLAHNLIKGDNDYIHTFKIRDNKGRCLNQHCGIWLLELGKFNAQQIETEQQRWLRFFKDGDHLNDEKLPNWMTTDEMRQAMSTLKQFSEKERDYWAYQARQDFLRQQGTMEYELDEAQKREQEALTQKQAALAEKQTALAEKQIALSREQAALAELERLKALLAKYNLNS